LDANTADYVDYVAGPQGGGAMMDAETEFQQRLERKINEAIAYGTEQVASGAAPSFDEYRYRCGFLKALSQMLEMTALVAREMSQPQNPKRVP
jgi:hypothetical protein